MLNFKLTCVYDKTFELHTPSKVVINSSKNVPCDDLTVTLPLPANLPEIKFVEVFEDNEKIFDGIVDEQDFLITSGGSFLTICARSKTALLLDNEAEPCTYFGCNLETIFWRHVAPFGFCGYVGSNKTFKDNFVIEKGTSHWDVLNSFCTKYLGSKPYFSTEGFLKLFGTDDLIKTHLLSNSQPTGLKHTSYLQTIKRYKVISQIRAKTDNSLHYNYTLNSAPAEERGIVCHRYLNTFLNSSIQIKNAKDCLNESLLESCLIRASCVGFCKAEVRDLIALDKEEFGELALHEWEVESKKYILDSKGERTEITLKRRKCDVDK